MGMLAMLTCKFWGPEIQHGFTKALSQLFSSYFYRILNLNVFLVAKLIQIVLLKIHQFYNPPVVLCFFRGLVDSQDQPLGYTELVPIWYIVGLI